MDANFLAGLLFVNACVLCVVYVTLLFFICKIVRSEKFKQKFKVDDGALPPVPLLYQFFGWLFK